MTVRGIVVLGSTGSIGRSTLDVVARHPDRFRAVALSARQDVDTLYEQCLAHRPDCVAMLEPEAAQRLRSRLSAVGLRCEVLSGPEGMRTVAAIEGADSVMAAIVGAAGLEPTLAAVRAGRRVLLANKEALVMAGGLFIDAVERHGAELLPIDSEHNAIFQCLPRDFARGLAHGGVRRILLTASGGPFRAVPIERLEAVTPDEACAHPNWVMGRKISVDSATMMNKGLEVIEAHWLFGLPRSRIDVVIHPQSVIHSMVEYEDGSVLAQMGNPDMRTPIAHALAYPDRVEAGVERLDLTRMAALSFEAPDLVRFPCLALAFRALEQGGAAPIALNAANECAVERFLAGAVPFQGIARVVEEVLDATRLPPPTDLASVAEADREARHRARAILQRFA